jgi:glyceraldehyde-3-phosphate dehydrogenase (NAD(P))
MNIPKVGIVGYGVIGRRVADAVRLQKDMSVSGVACISTSKSIRDAGQKGYDIFLVDTPKSIASIPCPVQGSLDELVEHSDVILDCTPSGIPPQHISAYTRRQGLVAILQGGEKHDDCECSFNAFANYNEAIGKKLIRVISCSSTGITRFLYTMDTAIGVKDAFVTLVRRSSDPAKLSKVPVNALTPKMGQSHHGPDVNTVLPNLNLFTLSVDCLTTFAHVTNIQIDLERESSTKEVIQALDNMPRIIVKRGLRTTADIAELYRDLGRSRQDRPEIYVWEEGIHVQNRVLHATISVHMESITIPETVDCIRSALSMEENKWASIYKTDLALGINKHERCYPLRSNSSQVQ